MLANRGRMITAAESGDRDAFLGLYDQFGPMLYRFCFWLTGNERDARELVTQTFARAFRAFRKRPRDMVLDTWFFRMAVRTFLASVVRRWFTRRWFGPVELEDRTLEWREAVVALSPRPRVVWLLTLAEGMPQSQTAEALGVSLDRVESLLERARAEFRPPEPDAERAAVERAMRQLSAPRPGAALRAEVAAALGRGGATVRARVMQGGIGLVVLALLVSVGFSLLRGPEETEAAPEQAEAQPKTIVVLGVADTGALLSFDAQNLRPATLAGVGATPRALALSPDGATLYVLQEDGLLTVDARSLEVGRLISLPAQEWNSLAIAGQYVVLGAQTAPALMATNDDDVSAEIPLPWPVDRLLPLSDSAILAVSADRTQMARVAVDSRSVGEIITIGADLALGAVVPAGDGASAYATTPETEEIWRVGLDTGQAVRVAASPAARATHGALSADETALYLSVDTGPLPAEPTPDSTPTAQAASRGAQPKEESSESTAEGEESVTAEEAPALTMINTSDGSVERELWQGGGITRLALDADRNILYALAPRANAILVLDSHTLHVRNVVPLAVRPVSFALIAEDSE